MKTTCCDRRRSALCALVTVALICVAVPAAAEPTAEEHYSKGKQLYGQKQYAEAASNFAEARRLDPQPRFVFNLAQAQRQAGDCKDATVTYREFLATNPPEAQATIARSGIAKCAATTPAPPTPTEPVPVAPTDPAPTVPRPPAPVPVTAPASPVAGKPAQQVKQVRVRGPWYRDVLGDVLLSAGIVVGLSSLNAYWNARNLAATTHQPGTLGDFARDAEEARTSQTYAISTSVVSGCLLILAVVRYKTRPSHLQSIVVTPTATGATVSVEARF